MNFFKVNINVCRVCLKSQTGTSMHNDNVLLENFREVTQLKVNENDGLPSILCTACTARLKIAHEFRTQALDTDHLLRNFFNKMNNEFKIVASSTLNTSDPLNVTNETELELLKEAGYNQNASTNKDEMSEIYKEVFDENLSSHGEEEVFSEFMKDNNYDNNDDDGNDVNIDDIGGDDGDTEEENETHLEFENLSTETVMKNADISNEMFSNEEPTNDNSMAKRKKKLGNETHICIKCDKDFSSKSGLFNHMRCHDGFKPFQCTVCGKSFTQSKSLTIHKRLHTGEKPYECNICGRKFNQKQALQRHYQTKKHLGTSPTGNYSCSICNKNLVSKYSLGIHMKRHSGYKEGNHKCNICEKTYVSKADLGYHLRRHAGEKPFKCSTCDKEFLHKSSLITHSKIHTEDETSETDISDNKNKVKISIRRQKEPSGRVFRCNKCSKRFSVKENFLQHLKNHNRDSVTNFKCEECGIAFNTSRGFKLHRFNEHKEEVADLNECDMCNIPFVSVHDFNQHMIDVHDKIDKNCQVCEQHFTSQKLMEDHLLEHELNVN